MDNNTPFENEDLSHKSSESILTDFQKARMCLKSNRLPDTESFVQEFQSFEEPTVNMPEENREDTEPEITLHTVRGYLNMHLLIREKCGKNTNL